MSKQIEKSFKELVALKFQLYNSLFLTLPLDAVEQTGLLLPLLHESCETGYEQGLAPNVILEQFFAAHKPNFNKQEQIAFLFKIIQYVERQVVLIDALEEAAFNQINRTDGIDSWEQLKNQVNEHQLEERLMHLLTDFGVRLVLTAHPTQFYPGTVLAIASDLAESVGKGDIAYSRELLMQLGKTPFYRKQKPSVYDEAVSLIWYLSNIFYHAAGSVLERLNQNFTGVSASDNKLINLGFWPGGDRDGNPFVTIDTTKKVAGELRKAIIACYVNDIKLLKRRLSFDGVLEKLIELEEKLEKELSATARTDSFSLEIFLEEVHSIEQLVQIEHQGLFLEKIQSLRRKIQLFGFSFASIDVRQDSRELKKAWDALLQEHRQTVPANFDKITEKEQIEALLSLNLMLEIPSTDDGVINDTLLSFGAIKDIQASNGEMGAHRYIISNCRSAVDVARVMALARLVSWGKSTLPLDVVPLFETVDDLKLSGKTMQQLYLNKKYKQHLAHRNNKQTVMLGFSDGTKDGGYIMANWSIFKAKEAITEVSRAHGVEVLFFDGRGGPPARGGGNAHQFYAALGKTIESKQIQITVQGQTISSHYGNKDAAIHNLTHLLLAGIENNLFDRPASNLKLEQRKLIEYMADTSYTKYQELKKHPLFLPFLEERSTLKYYGMTNIGSRPSKRAKSDKLKFEDLRAIPFVGAWSQFKLNVPGFYGVGSALKAQEDQGNLSALRDLYRNSTFFKTLLANSMQSMSKTNFDITRYMKNDTRFGTFWELIHQEFLLSKEMVLKVAGLDALLDDNPRSQLSIGLRERIILPLLTVQQHALVELQKAKSESNKKLIESYEKMVMRSLFGNINASRNSV